MDPVKPPTPDEKAGLLLAITQLDMLITSFAGAPEKVVNSAKDFKQSLQDWADGKL